MGPDNENFLEVEKDFKPYYRAYSIIELTARIVTKIGAYFRVIMKKGKFRTLTPALMIIIVLFALAHGIYGTSSGMSKTFAGCGEYFVDRAHRGVKLIEDYNQKNEKNLAAHVQEKDEEGSRTQAYSGLEMDAPHSFQVKD